MTFCFGMDGFRIFDWGYGRGRGANRRTGVLIVLSTTLCTSLTQVREVFSPAGYLWGRGGGLRLKMPTLDAT